MYYDKTHNPICNDVYNEVLSASFEPFMCVSLVIERWQSFLFQFFFLHFSLTGKQLPFKDLPVTEML